MRNFLYILILTITIVSCKKEGQLIDPTINSNTVVFEAAGTFRGTNIVMEAGENDYYMYTEYGLNPVSKFVLRSELKQSTCSVNCPNSLVINLHAYTTDSSVSGFDVNQMFYAGKNFRFYVDSAQSGQIQDTNVVEVIYTDQFGVAYSSSKAPFQINQLTINSVQDFENNLAGMRTKLVDYSFMAQVSDSISAFSDTLMMSGIFAFAYPSP